MSRSSSSTRPSMRAPGTTSCMRLIVRMKVDFPQPDGPMSAVTCFGSMVSDTLSMARWAPNQALTPSTTMRVGMDSASQLVAPGEEPGDDGEEDDDQDERERAG